MKRIIMHWSAGSHRVSEIDRKHYHEIVSGDGERVRGNLLPEANLDTRDGNYAAHTRACNTGSIGLAMAAMLGAKEAPFTSGPYPITEKQVKVFCEMVAEYADTYRIPIARATVLTHAEVEPTLGIWQRGKWDITWLPGLSRPIDPVEAGDRLREMIKGHRRQIEETPNVKPRRPFFSRSSFWGR